MFAAKAGRAQPSSVHKPVLPPGRAFANRAPERLSERMHPGARPQGPFWDFGKIPIHHAASLSPGGLQRKLKVDAVDDPLEREADRVADQVMRMPAAGLSVAASPAQVSRKCAKCSEEETLQKKSTGSRGGAGEAPALVHDVVRSPGQRLDEATRAYFEPRFGQDFSRVRIHTDEQAAASARAVNAYAYTVSDNIVFDTGRFAPGTHEGKRLLAHELTHVVQQAGSASTSKPGPHLQRKWNLASLTNASGVDIEYERENGTAVPRNLPGFAHASASARQKQGIVKQKIGGEAQVANWVTSHYVFKNTGEASDFLQLRVDASLAGNAKAEALRYARASSVVWGAITERTAANPTPPARKLFEIADGGISAATVGDLGLIEVDIPFGEGGSVHITIPLKKVDEGAFAPFSKSEPATHDVPSTIDEIDVMLGARVQADADIESAWFGISPLISQDSNFANASGLFSLRFDPRPNPKAAANQDLSSEPEEGISANDKFKGDCYSRRDCTGKVLQRRVLHCHNCKTKISGESIRRPDGTCERC